MHRMVKCVFLFDEDRVYETAGIYENYAKCNLDGGYAHTHLDEVSD